MSDVNEYEDQTFNQARILFVSLLARGRGEAAIFAAMQVCGVLRNDAEVAAFDAWEQSH